MLLGECIMNVNIVNAFDDDDRHQRRSEEKER